MYIGSYRGQGTDDTAFQKTIEEVIADQYPTKDGWICNNCSNWDGGIKCHIGVFIAFVGANMKGCSQFHVGKECRHCGKNT